MSFITVMFLIITLSFILVKLFEIFKIPRVLAPIIIGMVVGANKDMINISSYTPVLETLATLGIIMLLFYIGLEMNLKDMKRSSKETITVALMGFFITFSLAFSLSYYILNFKIFESFIIAAVLSVTAEGLLVLLLEESRLIKSRIGEIILGAGFIDDIISIIMIGIISTYISFKGFSLISLMPMIIGALVFLFGYFLLKYVARAIDIVFIHKKLLNSYDLLTYSIIFLLTFAVFSEMIGLDFSIGAIFAGVLLNFALTKEKDIGFKEEIKIDHFIKNITFGFLSYFFFFWIGFNVDITHIFENPILGILFALIAFTGKYLAGLFTVYYNNEVLTKGSLIGIGMSTKGGVELVIAEIARKAGLISPEIFSSLVFMSIMLTIISPIIFNKLIKNSN